MNLSGEWHIYDDFGFGSDEGKLTLEQDGQVVSGAMTITESIENEDTFKVKCLLSGKLKGKIMILKCFECRIIDGSSKIVFLPGTYQGTINSKGQIVGCSTDEDDVDGIFVMTRV